MTMPEPVPYIKELERELAVARQTIRSLQNALADPTLNAAERIEAMVASSGSAREQEREPLDARVQRHDALLRIRELEAINAQVVRNRDALREREQELTNALREARRLIVALERADALRVIRAALGPAVEEQR